MVKIPVLRTKNFGSEQVGFLELDEEYAKDLCGKCLKTRQTPKLEMAIKQGGYGADEIVAVNIEVASEDDD
jgi:hypothetical protein